MLIIVYADVMELVDVLDSKSGVGNYVSVRPRPSANKKEQFTCSFFITGRRGETTFIGSSASEQRLEWFAKTRMCLKQNTELPFNASEQDTPTIGK